MTESNKFKKQKLFLFVKDHKDNFSIFPTFRLINTSQSEIRKISKLILDKVNNVLAEKTNVKNSTNIVKWFKSILNKKASSFVNVYVENFYPSILEKLLTNAIS